MKGFTDAAVATQPSIKRTIRRVGDAFRHSDLLSVASSAVSVCVGVFFFGTRLITAIFIKWQQEKLGRAGRSRLSSHYI